jgi:2-polyprenyl-6-methoxyphenol hydroxylase-like FAD-dependent oxidoreductase
MTERVLIIGAGIAGLGAAMALGDSGREVVVLDRDPPPPQTSVEEAFYNWERKGVTQLRHSHVFLGKLFALIRDKHPRLLEQLFAAGARELTFKDGLPPMLVGDYVPRPGDGDLSILFSRRTTLELVMRRYAQSLAGIAFVTEALVRAPMTERKNGVLHVTGLKVEEGGSVRERPADIVIDASGRHTLLPDLLRKQGVTIREEEEPAGILYYTRHYRLRDGQQEPERGKIPGAGDLGYIKYGIFINDNRHFSLTLALPEIEIELRKVIVRPEIFDRISELIPGAGLWTDPARAEPVSKVFSMGNLKSVWRHYVKDDEPEVLGFFAIGDATVRTNPLYGRGCSAGIMQAHALADVLAETKDQRERALRFEKRLRAEIRPFYDAMVKQDLQAIRRAKNEQNPNYKPRLKARIIKSFAEDAIAPATRSDISVLRAIMRPFHMLESPTLWLKNLGVIARILLTWMKPKSWKRGLYQAKLGPDRKEMFSLLNIAPVSQNLEKSYARSQIA